jgi:hypothetical protein
VSGHAHGFTNAPVANNNGKQILLTQAFSASTAYDDIDLSISWVLRSPQSPGPRTPRASRRSAT